ncbi:unnamed protein product [Symbiodinium sp. CCMP2456]|nr:unnamed protein product [Symbiodinium sp. CCMP2456]
MIQPRDMPLCIVCGKKPCGGEVELKDPYDAWYQEDLSWGRDCWPCWCLCMGMHYHPGCECDEYFRHVRYEVKMLFCRMKCLGRDHGNGLRNCIGLSTCCCCWSHYHCPRPESAPFCVCFNLGAESGSKVQSIP